MKNELRQLISEGESFREAALAAPHPVPHYRRKGQTLLDYAENALRSSNEYLMKCAVERIRELPCEREMKFSEFIARSALLGRSYSDENKLLCWYCGVNRADTVDHLYPVSRGGSNDFKNERIPCCRSCNSRKHNSLINVWLPKLVGAVEATPLRERIRPGRPGDGGYSAARMRSPYAREEALGSGTPRPYAREGAASPGGS